MQPASFQSVFWTKILQAVVFIDVILQEPARPKSLKNFFPSENFVKNSSTGTQ